MRERFTALLGFGLLAFTSAGFAQQYNMELTSPGNGTVADGVYVSPYAGTIQGNGINYAGAMICDDFDTESYLYKPWTATMTTAGALNGAEKFNSAVVFNGQVYTAQQAYDAAGWLANGLLANLNNTTTQTNYAFAIWDIFDGQKTDPDGGALALESAAFSAASKDYVASNVSVFTPNPLNASQEFLVVNAAPEIDPSRGASALTLLLGAALVLRARRAG
ncbi:MAG TPA: hypothetical protein VK437_14220 [Steroidobacteraceae bacterium]|nr:hypothetical protein [Steroidobacteraceae bacterium]